MNLEVDSVIIHTRHVVFFLFGESKKLGEKLFHGKEDIYIASNGEKLFFSVCHFSPVQLRTQYYLVPRKLQI